MKIAPRRALAAAVAVAAACFLPAPSPAAANGETCQDLNIPVALLTTMYGRLCQPSTPTHTVVVLVPGATYNSAYWDLPPGLVSFRAGMNNSGYATLVVDRLGTGRSSRPLSATLTASTQAAAVHQFIQRLHNGTFGPHYDKVIVGGHSLGGAISILESATFHDVNGVLIAGLAHHLDPVDTGVNGFLSMYPALLDPQLASRGLDPGYLTTRPGTRALAFHNPAIPTPQAIGHDESTKDAFTPTEAADAIGVAIISPYSLQINVPVLLSVSSGDELLCSPLPGAVDCSSTEALRAQEAPYFAPAAQLEGYLFPGNYGHSFNYAPNAGEFQQTVAEWADRMVGR